MVTTTPVAAAVGAGLTPTELDTYAQHAWLSGRIGEAIDLYSDLARVYRRSPHVHFKLGFLYLSIQDYTTAVRHFTTEIELHGDEILDGESSGIKSPSKRSNAEQQRAFVFCTYAGRSEALRALREVSKAEMDELYATNRGGNSRHSLLSMGCLYFRFGMHQRTDECFERCAALDSEDPEYLIEHAELRLAQRRYAVAASMFEKCRQHISASSPIYHRALIGEGSALIRQQKLQDAVILLLQAMNTLRNTIRATISETTSAASGSTTEIVHPPSTIELIHLYHRATNLYGGLCMLKGELIAALDTFVSVSQASAAFTDIVPFQLPTICITPGTKNQYGEVIESGKASTKTLSEAVRHLNELEWRYGPDPCLYFHRAHIYHATGDFEAFLHDLSMVEGTDHGFLKQYLKSECLGDFLDEETLSWVPLKFVEAIHDALESNEYRIPVTQAPGSSKSPRTRSNAPTSPTIKKQRSFSETAMLMYFQERNRCSKTQDEYASVFQLDIFRRLPESKRRPGSKHSNLAAWEGVIFDEIAEDKPREPDRSLQDLAASVLSSHGRNPCAHMMAGIFELERFNVVPAGKHLTDAIEIIDRASSSSGSSSSSASSLSQRWNQHLLQKSKFYCLIWRSLTYRVRIEMEKAVEDLNLAATIQLGEKTTGSEDPMLLIQRTLIMLLNGHLKAAYKLLRQLKKSIRMSRRQRPRSRPSTVEVDAAELIDMFSNAGLNTFFLLPLQVARESPHVRYGTSFDTILRENHLDQYADLDAQDWSQELKEEAEEEEAAISMVKYAFTKKATPQTEMLDKFYESGLLKLSVSGSISQVIPFFQAILSMDEGYLPPTNFASLEIFKCKEQEFMEEKLFNCFVRLGKRAKWLARKIKWKFEALIDSNLAHAYLPSDMETLWHRARMVQDQRNFTAAINDLTDCLALMSPHFSWVRGKVGEKASFSNETKRIQWLQLQLERGLLYMELYQWEKAMDDLTMVIAQAGKKSSILQASAFEARSTCLIRLHRYGHAIQDLQQLLALNQEAKKVKRGSPEDMRRREDRLLNCCLVGNLYCQLAVDQMKASTAVARRTSVMMTSASMKKATSTHLNMGFITRAGDYFDQADEAISGHFLVQYFRGRMYAISAQSRMAIQSLTACLRLHSMFLPALSLRGCIYAQENLFVLALADFYRVRHRSATYPHLHTSIGYCHLQRGSMMKAVESFTETILQRGEDMDALYMRGCALQELLVLENAIKDFEQVVNLCPDHHRAHYQLGVCRLLLKDYKGALQHTSTIVRLQPEWKDAWVLHGYACFCAERFDSAVSAYGSAIALTDSSEAVGVEKSRQRESMLFLFRAMAYLQASRYQAALNDVDLAVKRDNENYVAFLAKAFCLSKMGEHEKAAQTLAHCLPHYKKMNLMSPTEVYDSERVKLLAKVEAPRDVSVGGTGLGSAGLAETQSATVTAQPQKLFQMRQQHCDTEPKQVVKSLTERRASTMIYDRRTSTTATDVLERRSSSASNLVIEPSHRVAHKFSTMATASTIKSAAETAKANAKRVVRAKFLRVMQKLTFQHRVVKALENATSSKYKKGQQLTRALAEVTQPVSKVGWPKGTLTSRILVWAFNADGIHKVQDRRIDDALMAFTLAIQAHPLNADTNFNRGNVFLQIEVLHSAVTGFQGAVEQDDQCFRAHNNMGVAYFKMDRLDEAQDAFSTGLYHAQHSKERAILLYNLGVTFQALDKPDEALDFYQQAISNDATRTEFFNNRSAILHHQMRYAVALEDYNRALKLQNQGETNEAEESTEGDATSGFEARLNRAQLHIAMGNCTLAMQDLKVVLKTLTSALDQLDSDHRSQLSQSSATPRGKEMLQQDAQLATDLLVFCQKWRTAMRIAAKDFLFALHAVPCFAVYEFSPLLGPELVRLQELEQLHADEDADRTKVTDQLQVVPLPIRDSSFFDYERAFEHWDVDEGAESENASEDAEPQDAVRESKHDQWNRNYSLDIREALRASRAGQFEDAARWLLRAYYKTSLDSHDEYLLLVWRVQVTLQYDPASNQDGVEKAVSILREFLHERRSPHDGDDEDWDEADSKSGKCDTLDRGDDGDDEQAEQAVWKAQRRVIRADLFLLLGSLHQLNGQLAAARNCFRRALRLRHDHAYASLNYLQLSVVLGEYEAALDTAIHVLEMFLARSTDKPLPTHPGAVATIRTPRGLLQSDRSLVWMLPSITAAFQDPGVASLSAQLLSLLKEYRGLVSSQIQTNTSHIFKTQGAIASIVHRLRLALNKRPDRGYTTNNHDVETVSLPDDPLSTFNQTLDAFHEKILEAPGNYADDDALDDFYGSFQAQFTELCDEIAKSLPAAQVEGPEVVDEGAGRDNQDSEETIEDFLASIDRRQVPRRMSGYLRLRPGSTPGTSRRGSLLVNEAEVASTQGFAVSTALSPRRSSALSAGASLQPQRPATSSQRSRPRRPIN